MTTAKDRNGWTDFHEGAVDLYAQLDERLGPDPLPWEPWPEGEDHVPGGIRSHRLAKRTTLTLQRAFLEGKLIGFFGAKTSNRQIPSVAFADFKTALSAFTIGGLELDPLWPDEWQSHSGFRFAVRTEQFRSWLSTDAPFDPGTLPELPRPWDNADVPARIERREPSNLSFVPLSEALSFMAFGLALDSERLTRALEWKLLASGDSEHAIDELSDAVALFCDRAAAEPQVIRARGKYVDSYAGAQRDGHLLSNIEPLAFANYKRFDAMHDGLASGDGTSYRSPSLDYIFDRSRHDGYREVQVNRNDLMREFPPAIGSSQALAMPLPATLRDLGPVMGLEEAICMTAHGRPSNDLQMWDTAEGVLVFRDAAGIVIPISEDGELPEPVKHDLARRKIASIALWNAVRDGVLGSYLGTDDGQPIAIPRVYWNRVDNASLDLIYRGIAASDVGIGRPVLLLRQAFGDWLAKVAGKSPRWKPAQLPTIGESAEEMSPSDHKPQSTPPPRLPDGKLKQWWTKLKPEQRASTQDELVRMCRASHPANSISRARIRALDPGRKRGPKQFRRNPTA